MAFQDVLVRIRKEKHLSQAQLAKELYVTRQAISRWENGITVPGIDMIKLISRVLDVDIHTLVEMPGHVCQSCGMFITSPEQKGHEKDGSESPYCKWCYDQGQYLEDLSMEEMIEDCAPRYSEFAGCSLDEAVSMMGAVFPTLKRWN